MRLNQFDICFQGPNSTWVIESDKSAEQISQSLLIYLNNDSGLLISEIGGDLFWDSSDKSITDWANWLVSCDEGIGGLKRMAFRLQLPCRSRAFVGDPLNFDDCSRWGSCSHAVDSVTKF